MLDFFIALFGGAYYGGRIINDKLKTNAYDVAFAKKESSLKEIESKAGADYALEQWAEEYIQSGENFEKICYELADDFHFVFGDNWRNEVDIPKGYRIDYKGVFPSSLHAYWIYHILLAKKGKVDTWCLRQGFKLSGIKNERRDLRFAQRIEKHLSNIPGLKIVLKPRSEFGDNRSPQLGDLVFECCIMEGRPYRRLW